VAAPTGFSGTSPVGRAWVVGASEMATGVVVGSAMILAPAAAWPQDSATVLAPGCAAGRGVPVVD
jgi:hypothetical protein